MPTSALDPTHVPRVATRRGGILGSSWRNGVLSSCLKTWHHSGCAQALARWQLLVRKPVIGGCLGSRDGALETLHEPPGINLHCNGAPGACAYHPAALLAAARPSVHSIARPHALDPARGAASVTGTALHTTGARPTVALPLQRQTAGLSYASPGSPSSDGPSWRDPANAVWPASGVGHKSNSFLMVPDIFFFLHVYKQTSFTISAIPLPPRSD